MVSEIAEPTSVHTALLYSKWEWQMLPIYINKKYDKNDDGNLCSSVNCATFPSHRKIWRWY